MINIHLRITQVEHEGEIKNVYVQRRYRILPFVSFYKTLGYVSEDQIGKEVPLSTPYRFGSVDKALEFCKKKYGFRTITYTKRYTIIQ
jgi:hypothetical protein